MNCMLMSFPPVRLCCIQNPQNPIITRTITDNSQAQLQTFFQNLTIEANTSRPGHFAIVDNNLHGRETSESSQSATEAVPNARSAADSVVEGPGSDSAITPPREASRFSCCLATSFDPTLLRAPTRARQLSMVASDNLPFQEDWPNALELCESDTRAEALSIAKTLALTGASHSEASC